MRSKLQLVIDCSDAQRLVAFWTPALGYRVEDPPVGGDRSVPLNIRRERIEAEAARLADAGATRLYALNADGVDHYAVTMSDPEGNEFCVH